MSVRIKYLDILRIEAEDLVEDIEALLDENENRKEKEEITNYVFLNNRAILQREKSGMKRVVQFIDTIKPREYSDLDEMIHDIEERLREKIRSSNMAQALLPLLKRKLEKVKLYVTHITS